MAIVFNYFIIFAGVTFSAVSGFNGRIVGGKESTIEKHPWQVSIQLLGQHICGGSIINSNTILTAAHCIDVLFVRLYKIVAGATKLSDATVILSVQKYYIHKNYNSETFDYDVAIIKINKNLVFGNQIKQINLPNPDDNDPKTGIPVLVSGWGILHEGDKKTSDVLQEVQLNIVDRKECKNKLESVGLVTDRMICAGVSKGSKDTCQADSGGALEFGTTIFGIVSWGKGCGQASYPGVYTSVHPFRLWIADHSEI